jgi:hypothetical protein
MSDNLPVAKFERTIAILVECIKSDRNWTFSEDSPEFLLLFDFQNVCLKSGHFEGAVNKIDNLDSTYRGVV